MRNLTACDKSGAKRLGELLKGTNRICPYPVEPSHRHRFQTGWKYPTHQGLILRMDNHFLFKLTYVFYRIRLAIIHGKRWLVEPSTKLCLFYPPCKGGFRNLAQRLFHNVSSYSFARRAPAFPSMKMLFLTGEGFAWWGS